MASKFTHLHVHSHYSLLNALPKIPALIKEAKKNGMEAIALTDNGNLYGAIEFYKECKKQKIKPIVGVDAFVAVRTRFDKEPRIDNKRYRLILLAKNENGYKNLLKIVTGANLEGFYYKPRVDRELLAKNPEDIIAIFPSFSGEITQALKIGDNEKAKEVLDAYIKIFGKENIYLEITHHPEITSHEELMKKIISFAKENGAEIVATHDVYYLHPEDKKARDTLLAIQTSFEGDRSENGEAYDFSFITQEQARDFFKDIPEAISNTQKIADACDLKLELGKWVFPDFEVPGGKTPDEALRDFAYSGIELRGLQRTPELIERIEYELKVIKDKGYSPYFLVVSDLLVYAKNHHIFSTTRGSAGGSMVSYLTYITTVNPIEYNLPFERFLNPERPSAPDIDMDIADIKRDQLIQYAIEKYGKDKVAQVGTFGTMMARGAVRDVARAMGYPYSTGDQIAKMIPMGAQGFPMTIDKAMSEVPELKKKYEEEEDAKTIIDMAKKIEGCARHISIHAAGVVIAPTALTDFVPLQNDPKGGKLITQYDMHAVEDAGLLKFDFLGIKNLSILADAVDRVKKIRNIDVDIDKIPTDDKKTFEMLARGETTGLFQLNGDGMTRYLKELKPTSINDINLMVALYRPGPMATIDEYIARKHGDKKVTYYHPKMEKFLDKSFGLLVYQDDLLFTAIELAGYTWATVDKFRKAVGKKIPEEMAKQHEIFVSGCQEHSNMSKDAAEKIWTLFEPFQGYGFNKAHAASYGRVAYQTAYMKANFPAIYMSAVLTADSGDVEKIGETIAECKRMGIEVLPPDINESFSAFTVIEGKSRESDKIRFGLTTIKNFGEGISQTIIEERKARGKFTSLQNFLERIKDKNLNKKSLEALIMTGALDEFGERGELISNIEELLAYHKEFKNAPENQDSLFGAFDFGSPFTSLKMHKAEPASQAQKLVWEKELLGLYISGHPLDKFKEKLAGKKGIEAVRKELKDGMEAVISGIIEEAKIINTKKGERMAFIKVADFTGNMEVVVFPKTFTEFAEMLNPETCIAVKGRLSAKNGTLSLLAEKFKKLD
ncbi:MAG: DNA polymerase III subunit alpha [Candidatus Paceibacterota bacterium]